MDPIEKVEKLANVSDKAADKIGSVFSWFVKPKEEARSYLTKAIQESHLSPEETSSLAHGIPYVAQTTFIGNFKDISEKAHKAIYTPGAAFLNVMAPCPRGWRYPSEKLMEVTKMAVETCVWPLYEVIEGRYILNYTPKEKKPVEEYLRMQGRFAHMFKPGNEWMIEEVQKEVDRNWEGLQKLCDL